MATPKEIFEEQISRRISQDTEKAKAVGAVYKFVVTGDNGGTWVINLKDSVGVTEGDASADCTITVGSQDIVDVVSGKLSPQMAFMSGKLKIAGNMGLAMKLGQVLGQ